MLWRGLDDWFQPPLLWPSRSYRLSFAPMGCVDFSNFRFVDFEATLGHIMKFSTLALYFALLLTHNCAVAQDSTATVESEEPVRYQVQVARHAVEVCNLLMDHHVAPPAKQQLVAAAAKAALAMRTDSKAQSDTEIRRIGQEVSPLVSDAELEQFLTAILDEVGASEETTPLIADQLVQSILAAAPGGGQLTKESELKVDTQLAENRYVGIGIALSQSDGMPVISKCFYEGPGFQVGVRTNDVILEIDGAATSQQSLAEVVQKLRGEKGTDVTLLLRNPSDDNEREITVTRDVTFIPTVAGSRADENGRWSYRLASEPQFALLHIERFGPSTVHELKKLSGELLSSDQPLEGIILDLRRGGGRLNDVVMVADQFLEQGTIGGSVFPDRGRIFEAQAGSLFDGLPMVVLVAETSSASSTLLATALRDNDRAPIVGSATSGVSFIRGAFTLANGDRVVFPTGFIKRANGTVMDPTARGPIAIVPKSVLQESQPTSAAYLVPDFPVQTARHSQPANASWQPRDSDRVLAMAVRVLKGEVRRNEKSVAEKSESTSGADS